MPNLMHNNCWFFFWLFSAARVLKSGSASGVPPPTSAHTHLSSWLHSGMLAVVACHCHYYNVLMYFIGCFLLLECKLLKGSRLVRFIQQWISRTTQSLTLGNRQKHVLNEWADSLVGDSAFPSIALSWGDSRGPRLHKRTKLGCSWMYQVWALASVVAAHPGLHKEEIY